MKASRACFASSTVNGRSTKSMPSRRTRSITEPRVMPLRISLPVGRVTSWPSRVTIQAFVEDPRSEEHTSELQSLMRISYAVFCLKKKTNNNNIEKRTHTKNNMNSKQTTNT